MQNHDRSSISLPLRGLKKIARTRPNPLCLDPHPTRTRMQHCAGNPHPTRTFKLEPAPDPTRDGSTQTQPAPAGNPLDNPQVQQKQKQETF